MAESDEQDVEAIQLTTVSGEDGSVVFDVPSLDNAIDHPHDTQREEHGALDLADIIGDAVEASDPSVASLTPATAPVGAAPVTITVSGSNFLDGATVEVDQAAVPTTFVDESTLTTDWTPAAEGSYVFTVRNPNERESNDTTFTVTAVVAADDQAAEPAKMKAAKSTRAK
jgi:IPT/TIG domain